MRMFSRVILVAIIGVLSLSAGQEPINTRYKNIKTIEYKDFLKQKDNAVVIDVRSEREYEQAHINDALNVPLYKITKEILEKIVAENQDKPLIFYCISEECGMSFQAASIAASYGIKNVLVFEAGFLYFISHSPDQCVYAGNSLSSNFYKDYIMQRLSIAGKIISWDKVAEKANSGYVLINLGNPEYFVEKMDKYVSNYLRYENVRKELKAGNAYILPERRFVLLDNFGREAVWLEDDLIKLNKMDYYYVEGGLKGYFESIKKSR